MSLMRWSPFEEMNILRNQINSVFDSPSNNGIECVLKHSLPVEVSENSSSYFVNVMVPGIDPGQLQVETSKNELTITATTSPRQLEENEKIHLSEFHYGQFSRRIAFPLAVDTEKVEAKYEFGILKISVPKVEAVLPKRIEIKIEKS